MSGRKFYCICDANCKFETMTKEQIIAALSAATPSAHIEDGCLYLTLDGAAPDVGDGAFITQLLEGNANKSVSVWVGTEAEFNAIAPAVAADSFVARIDESGKVYICTNDSLMALIRKTLHDDFIRVGDEDLEAQRIAELNRHDYMAGALKQAQGADSAYIDKPVQMCYQTKNVPAATADTPLAIWVDKGDGVTELQPLPVWQVKEWLETYFYTKEELNTYNSGEINTTNHTFTSGKLPKFFTVAIGNDEDSRRQQVTLDVNMGGGFVEDIINGGYVAACETYMPAIHDPYKYVNVSLTARKATQNGEATITIQLYENNAGFYKIKKICGHY